MKQRATYILFLLTSLISFGQVTVEADTDLKEVPLNRELNLIVMLNVIGEEYRQESQVMLPDLSKFEILGTASQQLSIIDPANGVRTNQIIFRALIQTKKAGRIKIGSALVKVNGKMYKSEPFEITVTDSPIASAPKPENSGSDAFLALELKQKNIYENQSALAVLKVYSRNLDDFRRVHSVKLPTSKSVRVYQVNNVRQQIVPPASPELPAYQIIGTYLIIPEKSGSVEVGPVTAQVGKRAPEKISSSRLRLNVKHNAPAPANFTGAVGSYTVEMKPSINLKEVEVNKPLNIQIKLAGKGNIKNSLVPKLQESPDYHYFKPKVSQNISVKPDGLVGNITYEYVVIPKKNGKIELKTESFTYYNPESKKYISAEPQPLLFSALTPQQIEDQKSTVTKVLENTNTVLETVQLPAIVQENNRRQIQKGINWQNIILNFGIVGAIGLLLLGANQYRKRNKNTLAPVEKPVTSVSDVERNLRENQKEDVQTTLDYMYKQLQQRNYSKFFASYNEMEKELENLVKRRYNQSFKNYLEKTKGVSFVEEHRLLQRQMNIEKYAPVHDDDHLFEVFGKIRKVFSEIAL